MSAAEKTSFYATAFRKLLIEEGNEALFPYHLLEKYPHIFDKIFLLWVDPPSTHKYFSELLTTNRESRAGFPPEVYSELFTLETFYSVKHPIPIQKADFWVGINKRD